MTTNKPDAKTLALQEQTLREAAVILESRAGHSDKRAIKVAEYLRSVADEVLGEKLFLEGKL